MGTTERLSTHIYIAQEFLCYIYVHAHIYMCVCVYVCVCVCVPTWGKNLKKSRYMYVDNDLFCCTIGVSNKDRSDDSLKCRLMRVISRKKRESECSKQRGK